MSLSLAAAWYYLAQAVPDTPDTWVVATFTGYGICGILAGLYIIDQRKTARADREIVTNILTTIGPVLGEIRDVMLRSAVAHDAAAAASKATSETLERFSQRIPSHEDMARVHIALERLDRR